MVYYKVMPSVKSDPAKLFFIFLRLRREKFFLIYIYLYIQKKSVLNIY